MLHDVLACLEQVEALSAHEVHCFCEAALDEVVSLCVVVGFFGAVDVQLRQAVVDNIPCKEIYAPSQPFFYLGLTTLMKHLPRASLPIAFLDLAVPAPSHPLWILMLALNLPHSVRAITLPPIQQRILAELLTLDYFIRQAHAIFPALYRHFLALQPLVDHRSPLRRGRNISIDLLILPKRRGNDGPLGRIGLEMRLILHQSIQITLLHLIKLPEKVLLGQHSDDLLIEDREVPESLGGICTEDLVPGYESPQVCLELQWRGVEIALAVSPKVLYGNIFAEAYILQLMGL